MSGPVRGQCTAPTSDGEREPGLPATDPETMSYPNVYCSSRSDVCPVWLTLVCMMIFRLLYIFVVYDIAKISTNVA
jgi:hypothetical protein